MSDESAGSFWRHSAADSVVFVLLFADSSDFRVSCFWMHEYKSADACVRCHGVAFCHLNAQCLACELVLVCVAVLVAMSLASAAAVVTVQILAFSEKFENILLECMIWTT